MRFNVAQLLKAPVGTTRTLPIDESLVELTEGVVLTEPLRGSVKMTRTNRGVLVDVNLKTAGRLECSRCLEPFVQPLTIRFSEEYIPVVDIETGLPAQIPHESYDFQIGENHELDLLPAVREYGLLELPMQPLCKPECAGLCPQCGQNLNVVRCQCHVEPRDERLAALKALLTEENTTRS